MADAHEALGQHVEQKAADELFGIEGLRLQSVIIFSVPVAKTDLAVVDSENAIIGERYAMGVAAKVVEYGLRGSEGFFA